MQIRHGDVFLRKIESIDKGLKKVESNVIEAGEATGHHHRGINMELYADDKGVIREVEVPQEGYLVHEDHYPIQVEKGAYEIVRQVEYNPYEETARRVMD